jgi:flagellar biosynthesis component FlhA
MKSQTSSTHIVKFANGTKNVCFCVSLSIFMIILFMMTPLNKFMLSSIFGKIIILTLLGYAVFYNVKQTNQFTNDSNVSLTSGNWNTLKSNIICSYIFSLFLVILMLSVFRQFF